MRLGTQRSFSCRRSLWGYPPCFDPPYLVLYNTRHNTTYQSLNHQSLNHQSLNHHTLNHLTPRVRARGYKRAVELFDSDQKFDTFLAQHLCNSPMISSTYELARSLQVLVCERRLHLRKPLTLGGEHEATN